MKIKCKLTKKRAFSKPTAPLPKPPSRLARHLALAYAIDRAIEAGDVESYADAARRLGVSRARVSQIMNHMILPTPKREAILMANLN